MPRVAIYTEEEAKRRKYLSNLRWKKNNKDKVKEYNHKSKQKEEYHSRELLRMHRNYAVIKEYNRLKHLGCLCI